jgi:hypothetical protein
MTAPSLSQPWVLIRNGKAPPALACLTREFGSGFVCDLMVVETNPNTGQHEWRKRSAYEIAITDYDILHVFPYRPSPSWVVEARRALRRKADETTLDTIHQQQLAAHDPGEPD